MGTPIRVKNPFKDRQEKLITALEMYWNEFGCLPSGGKLVEKGVILSEQEYLDLMEDEFVIRALDQLGIKTDEELQVLTPKQLAAVQVMFDFHDTRSDSKKLRDLGINSQTWDNWLKDPTFQKYLQVKIGNLFEDNTHEIDRALFLKARSGHTDSIKLLYSVTGRYKEIEAPKIGNVEAHVFLMKLFEVLQQNLIDQPEKLKAIADSIINIQSPYMQHNKVIEAVPIEQSS